MDRRIDDDISVGVQKGLKRSMMYETTPKAGKGIDRENALRTSVS